MHFAILSKHIFLNLFLKLFLLHKVVLTPMNFTLSWSSGGVADAQLKYLGEFLQQVIYECAFSHSRAPADYQRLELLNILLVVEISKVIASIVIDILRLL